MDKKAIIKYCKELGCCDACCIRYLGHRNPGAFENTHEFLKKLLGAEGCSDRPTEPIPIENKLTDVTTTKLSTINTENGENKIEKESVCNIDQKCDRNDESTPENTDAGGGGGGDGAVGADGGTPAKRARRSDVCFTCIGILQEESWPLAVRSAQAELEAKGYECKTFACALSGPISTAFREKVVTLRLKRQFPQYDLPLTPLKEAWKWSFCAPHLATRLGLALQSGALAGLLLTFHMDYAHDMQELGELSSQTRSRRISNRRELDACLSSLREVTFPVEPPREPVVCLRVLAAHEPAYIGGRYIKLSRSLPQTPWLLHGERMMPSSVQEVIFAPIAALYGIAAESADRRLKLVAAGREDVDVRCLGDGRPFAVEILDPRFTPTQEQLSHLCEKISEHEHVKVKTLRNVDRSQLAELKKGEETKLKSYQALCIKLRHTDDDTEAGAGAVAVSAGDVRRINALTARAPLELRQRTPLRVLHRRPLHTRTRALLDVRAACVPGHPQLVTVRLVAQAGTYIKEWVHGEVGRTTPSLRDVVPLDILALDVTAVQLDWPPAPSPPEHSPAPSSTSIGLVTRAVPGVPGLVSETNKIKFPL